MTGTTGEGVDGTQMMTKVVLVFEKRRFKRRNGGGSHDMD